MNQFIQWLDNPLGLRLAEALVHFVWQGAAIGAAAAVILSALRRATSQVRYAALLMLFSMAAACPVVTFCLLPARAARPATPVAATVRAAEAVVSGPSRVSDAAGSTFVPNSRDLRGNGMRSAAAGPAPDAHAGPVDQAAAPAWRDSIQALRRWLDLHLTWIAAAWLAGVGLLSARLVVGWLGTRRYTRRGTQPVEAALVELANRLTERLGLSRPPTLVQSVLVDAPAVIGWLKPVVLLPAAALTGLSPQQFESVMAHELAHIRRHDYVINLLQSVVETLLFYHPAVWWLSGRIRIEREYACDELAVAACGDRLALARALAMLEQLRSVAPRPVLAAKGGALKDRIVRLLGRPCEPSRSSACWLVAAVFAASVAALLWVQRGGTIAAGEQPGKAKTAVAPGTPTRRVDLSGDALPPGALVRLGTGRLHQASHIACVAFSPDGKTLVSGGYDGAHLWEAKTGKWLRQVGTVPHWWTHAVAFSADGQLIVSAGEPNKAGHGIWISQVATGREIRAIEVPESKNNPTINTVAISPNGRLLATGSADGVVSLWDTETGEDLLLLDDPWHGDRGVECVTFSPDGMLLASGAHDGTIRIWNVQSGETVHKIAADPRDHATISSLAFAADGATLIATSTASNSATASYDGRITFWDSATGQQRPNRLDDANSQWLHPKLALSEDGQHLAVADHEQLRVWRLPTGKLLATIDDYVNDHAHFSGSPVALSPDGKLLAASGGGKRHLVRLWDTGTGAELLNDLPSHANYVTRVQYLPGGKQVMTSGKDGTTRLWNAGTARQIRQFSGGMVALSIDGRLLATNHAWPFIEPDGAVRLFEVNTGREAASLATEGDWIPAGTFSRDGRYLAVLSSPFQPGGMPAPMTQGSTIHVFDTADGKQVLKLLADAPLIHEMCFSTDGRSLHTVNGDLAVATWSLATGKLVSQFVAATAQQRAGYWSHVSAAFAPDASSVLIAGQKFDLREKLAFWDVATGQRLREVPATGWNAPCLAFAPSGRFFAYASTRQFLDEPDFQIHVCDTATGRELLTLDSQRVLTQSLAFSPNEKRLVCGLPNGTALVRDVSSLDKEQPEP